jgi:EmrB/QacA subfamily drug resistance transporter
VTPAGIAQSDEKWVLIPAILASGMAFIDTTALTVALPTVQNALSATGTQLLWVSNAYALFLSALILVGGALGDLYGRKRIFAIGIAWFAAASILCGIAPDADFLIAARALKGIGGALMVPGSLALISALFPTDRRGRAIGTWSMFSTLTTLFGPLLGGWLAEQGLWRAIFLINVPLGIIALGVLLAKVPENRSAAGGRRLDWMGAALATLSLAAITYGFTEASRVGWGNSLVGISVIAGLVLMILFVAYERRAAHPMVDLSLFRSRTFSGTNLLTLFLYAALNVFIFFTPINLVQIQGYPQSAAGLTNLPFSILLILLSRTAGGWVDRIGARPPLIAGPALTGVGFAMLALPGVTGGTADYWLTYFPAIILLGIGMGITVAPLTTAVMSSAPQQSAGTASGINNTISRAAGVLAIAILGAVALNMFAAQVNVRAAALPLTAEQQATLSAATAQFADAQPPGGLSDEVQAQVTSALQWSFVETYRVLMLICALLAWISAGMAAIFVEPKRTPAAVPAAASGGR